MMVSRNLLGYLRSLTSTSQSPTIYCIHTCRLRSADVKRFTRRCNNDRISNFCAYSSSARFANHLNIAQRSVSAKRSLSGNVGRRKIGQANDPVDNPNFQSILDEPPRMVSANRKHSYGLLILAVIPITAFALGTWQVQRLGWKTDLIARFEDRLVQVPLPLPPTIDPEMVPEFDYRRVYATGRLCHDQEMLVGPRMHEGEEGYLVITPLDRELSSTGSGSKILINRGWISKNKGPQTARAKSALPTGEITVAGLLREPFKKNFFTPDNKPQKSEFYFPDLEQMARLTDSQPVWIEETMTPDLYVSWDREAKGIPIGRPAEVNLRNNHTQYIFTWYGLAFATSIMFWMVARGPRGGTVRNRVRHTREWS